MDKHGDDFEMALEGPDLPTVVSSRIALYTNVSY